VAQSKHGDAGISLWGHDRPRGSSRPRTGRISGSAVLPVSGGRRPAICRRRRSGSSAASPSCLTRLAICLSLQAAVSVLPTR